MAAAAIGLAAGQRVGRKDTGFKKMQSRIANGVRNAILRDGTRDTGCGLKAFRRDVFLVMPYFDGLHRFLPALVRREGYDIAYVDVIDRPRHSGVSNYGFFDRLWIGIMDLAGVWWLIRRKKPTPVATEVTSMIDLIRHARQLSVRCLRHQNSISGSTFGLVAQLLFHHAFLVQWIIRARARRSVVPMAFWFFSMGGGVMTLIYGIVKREPVIILGQSMATVIYVRNIMLILKNARANRNAGPLGLPTRNGVPEIAHALPIAPSTSFSANAEGQARLIGCGVERRKAALEIGFQVIDMFQPDMQPQRRPARRPFGGRAIAGAVERNDEAFKAAPRITHAEQFNGIEQRIDGFLLAPA